MPEKKSSKKKRSWKNIANAAIQEILKDPIARWLQKHKNKIIATKNRLKQIGNVAPNNYNLGIKHYNWGNFDDAILRFKFVIKLEPLNHDAYYWLAASYFSAGNKPAARITLKKLLAMKPDYKEALELLTIVDAKEEPSADE